MPRSTLCGSMCCKNFRPCTSCTYSYSHLSKPPNTFPSTHSSLPLFIVFPSIFSCAMEELGMDFQMRLTPCRRNLATVKFSVPKRGFNWSRKTCEWQVFQVKQSGAKWCLWMGNPTESNRDSQSTCHDVRNWQAKAEIKWHAFLQMHHS